MSSFLSCLKTSATRYGCQGSFPLIHSLALHCICRELFLLFLLISLCPFATTDFFFSLCSFATTDFFFFSFTFSNCDKVSIYIRLRTPNQFRPASLFSPTYKCLPLNSLSLFHLAVFHVYHHFSHEVSHWVCLLEYKWIANTTKVSKSRHAYLSS